MHYVRINPGNTFRLVVKVGNYVADVEYGIEIAEQEHELWLDITKQYTIENAEGTGDTCTSPPSSMPSNIPEPVDWANLIVHQDE
jgi:hypothetical protein